MKDVKRSARTLNWILNAVLGFLVLRGMFAAGFHIAALYQLFTDPAWFFVTAVLVVLAMVFRQGEQLQTLADETL
ncbi:MAG: hypothetical protein IJX04_02540 [Oscillospiraceae bacterium]|nr:hypothetical protein [Oscillospiraceae bacterium]